MNADASTSQEQQPLLTWERPEIVSTAAFTQAALACCEITFEGVPIGDYQGSTAAQSGGPCP